MIGDPTTAPPRTDLPFLRRRSRPRVQPAEPPASPPRSSGIDYTHSARRSAAAAPPPAPAAGNPLDLSGGGAPTAPSRQGGIDYAHRGRPSAPATPAAPSPSTSTPPRPTTPAASRQPPTAEPVPAAPSGPGLLDLSDRPAARPTAPTRPARPAPRVHRDVRVAGRQVHVLQRNAPTVTLSRTQSGIGELSVEAVCSPSVGDLRLGAAYQLRSGGSSTVQLAGGHRFGPASSRRPVLVASREEYERISLDLRQIGDIERVVIYAFSESRATLTWGGTLVLTTYAGGRIELPLETLHPGSVAVLLSLYNLDGELVVRGEMETIAGDVREAARAYGFDRITWRDDRMPVD